EGRAVSVAGKTSLRELAALISECDALVSTDSGPMHIGYATRTPLVAIFGSTEPSLTGPVGYGFKVIRHALSCTPCYKRECPAKEDMACMKAVTVDEVFEALCKVLPEKG
ncbi:MAG: lipopolysaccharide heptosyltransferase II, partial [Armatimonadetes bacterium]|nr:lipopolysaccharide heptosyltransferase II [Armatimonadota bacterium]